jgi:hypothetical protein
MTRQRSIRFAALIKVRRREKIGKTLGTLDDRTMLAVNRALALFLGFA